MPKTKLHKRQQAKNWLLFAILFSLSIIFFWLTILKISGKA